MSKAPKASEVSMRVTRVLADPSAPIKAAQHFQITRVGDDLQLDVGHFDMMNLKDTIDHAKKGEGKDLYFVVTDRFFLSKTGFEALVKSSRDMEEAIARNAKEAGNASA